MPRPKGSRNKPKVVKEDKVEAATKSDSFNPKPDMGSIKAPADSVKACGNCGDRKDAHYGGPKGWCNVGGCACQVFH